MMTPLRNQLEMANKRINYLETQVKALEGLCLERVSPEMFSRMLVALSKFVSTNELVDILIGKKEEDE